MSLNWDKIRIFHAVADAESLTKASLVLHSSQSALSRQITSLENQLGVSLFHRHARGLKLTEQGDILYKNTKDIHQQLNFVKTQIQDSHSKASGVLTVTAPGFLGGNWLMPHIKKFQSLYPDVRLNFLLTNKVFDLSLREADVALHFFEPEQSNLIKRKLTEFQFYICASHEYIDRFGEPKKPKNLRKHRLIGYPDGINHPHQHTDWIFNIAGIKKDTYQNSLLINSMVGITELVNTDTGIACLPKFMIKDYPNIKIILKEYAPPTSDLFFIYSEERRNSKKISVFRDFMLDFINAY